MNRLRISHLSIINFKLIKKDSPLALDFEQSDLILLNGPNGYGKSTVFDAIELLFTGEIKHFRKNHPNTRSDSFSILANDRESDIKISAVVSDGQNDIFVSRLLLSKENFEDRIFINDSVATQDELDERFGITKEMYRLGMYVSQSDSLDFLDNKYKTRKEQLSSLLGDSSIVERVTYVTNLKKAINEKIESILEKVQTKAKQAEIEHAKLIEKLKEFTKADKDIQFIELFGGKHAFDKREINFETSYEITVKPLIDIEEMLANFDEYEKTIHNSTIRQLKSYDKEFYKALFFKSDLEFINQNSEKANMLENTEKYLFDLKSQIYTLNKDCLVFAGVSDETINEFSELIAEYSKRQKNLSEGHKALTSFIKQRKKLVDNFTSDQLEDITDKSHCPLCGKEDDDLETLFLDTEVYLKKISSNVQEDFQRLEENLEHKCAIQILPAIESTLEKNSDVVDKKKRLKDLLLIDPRQLETILEHSSFSFNQHTATNSETLPDEEFILAYEQFMKILDSQLSSTAISIPDEKIDMYKATLTKYYDGKKPSHTLSQIKDKRLYINSQYTNSLSAQIKAKNEELLRCNQISKKLQEELKEVLLKEVKSLHTAYAKALKDYRTNLLNGISVPLFVFSGKIVQNFPLGLGILAKVDDAQVVFFAPGRTEDIYNMLSTGQLNGVMVSIMLAIKSVFGDSTNLDLILIDDPLQSIDDISSISLVDLLINQFSDTQVFFSTHEEEKANLLYTKYTYANRIALPINLQKKYLS